MPTMLPRDTSHPTIALLLLFLLSVGCGYRPLSSAKPFGVTSITVVPFHENEPIGFSQSLSNDLSLYLAQAGVTLSRSIMPTGAVLSGTVESASVTANPTSSIDKAIPSFGISVRLSATLEDHKGRILWENSYSLSDSFLQDLDRKSESVLVTESNRRVALKRLSNAAAQQLLSDLMISHSLTPTVLPSESEAHNASSN